ncbi:hypothetical protein [Flavobacterium sp.]|jgi:hypothetical protein|uniref:hypothetical protein n=1 Tax=Flavobacterium sp. TaxID=239 RepID=UPI0037C064F3
MNATPALEQITPAQQKILVALATFKYLTTGQLLFLEVMSDRANINKNITVLKNRYRPLVGSISFGVHPKLGKLQNIHYLTSHGAMLLKENFGERFFVRYPKGKNGLFQQDYFHRVNLITFHIHFNLWAMANDLDLLFFRAYFDKLTTGKEKGYRAESAIPINEEEYLIADAICMLQTVRRLELLAVEMYNGDDTHRVHDSLFYHLQALSNGQPSKKYGLNYGSRVLCVFELESYKIQAMKRLNEDARFASAKKHFLFKSLDELSVDSFFDWWLFDGTTASLF